MTRRFFTIVAALCLVLSVGFVADGPVVFGQGLLDSLSEDAAPADGGGSSLNLLDDLGGANSFGSQSFGDGPLGGDQGSERLIFFANYEMESGTRLGRIQLTAKMGPGWHVYSTTQPKPLKASEFATSPAGAAKILGPAVAVPAPKVHFDDILKAQLEEHYDTVTWTIPIQLSDGVTPESFELRIVFTGQVCHEQFGCVPVENEVIPVAFAGTYEAERTPLAEAPVEFAPFKTSGSHVSFTGTLEPRIAAPGQTAMLRITAVPDPEWHVYAHANQIDPTGPKPFLFGVKASSPWEVGTVSASQKPNVKAATDVNPEQHYHDSPVTWSVPIKIPVDAAPNSYPIAGVIGFQTCSDVVGACDAPNGATFRVDLNVGTEPVSGKTAFGFTKASYSTATAMTATDTTRALNAGNSTLQLDQITVDSHEKELPIWKAMAIALFGGFILNLMPCVLPVIGLKILSFVEQAGESKAKALALNMWYVAGLLSVFLVLATLTVVASFGWGTQNQSLGFQVTMTAVVFTMALSFLGVWEIPIPGFVGSGKAQAAAEKEGYSGAFAKGVITTILAVPCSGPGIATALTWCQGKPSVLVYLVFMCLGLGMASPYIVIGFNHKLARFLPKPGAWMDTFKQLMGFVLLATVIWLMTTMPFPAVIPTLAFLFGLWAACWWIGRTPVYADFNKKVRAWAVACIVGALTGGLAFGYLDDVMYSRYDQRVSFAADKLLQDAGNGTELVSHQTDPNHLPWKPFSLERLQEYADKQQTVMVDFTADWCPTCKVLENVVLNTEAIRGKVDANRITPLLADYTEKDPQMKELIVKLGGSDQIPLLAIFPAGQPNKPIVLKGSYTQNELLQRLDEAGPSVASGMSADDARVAARQRNDGN